MAKILIMTFQVNLCFPKNKLHISLTLIVIVKIFTISLPLQPFLDHHLGFHILFTTGATHFFTAGMLISLPFVHAYCEAGKLLLLNICCFLPYPLHWQQYGEF